MRVGDGPVGLKSDDYDSSEAVERLVQHAHFMLGPSVWRMVGPEIETFIRYEVANALLNAFSKAEALCINDAIKRSDQMSLTILEGVMAGIEIGKETEEEDDGE